MTHSSPYSHKLLGYGDIAFSLVCESVGQVRPLQYQPYPPPLSPNRLVL